MLFDTPIVFPVSWDHSKIDGFTGRINLVEHGGFSAFTVMAHTNAIFSPPGTAASCSSSRRATSASITTRSSSRRRTCSTSSTRPSAPGRRSSWRYDSGLVAGSVPDYATALTLTADQQAAIGLFCGSTVATLGAPITELRLAESRRDAAADSGGRHRRRRRTIRRGSRRATCSTSASAPTTCCTADRAKLSVRFSVVNLTNKEALYNFLSTFSGTHFVTPRAYPGPGGRHVLS